MSSCTEGLCCQTLPGATTVLCWGHHSQPGQVPQVMGILWSPCSQSYCPTFWPPMPLGAAACALHGPPCLGAPHPLAWHWPGLRGCRLWGSPQPTGPPLLTSWGWAHPGLDLGTSMGQLPCGLWAQGAGAGQCSWEWWDMGGHEGKAE